MWLTVKHRFNYYCAKVYKFFGKCYSCGEELNYTRHGQGVCPSCKKRI